MACLRRAWIALGFALLMLGLWVVISRLLISGLV
jgi:hypothetical protein